MQSKPNHDGNVSVNFKVTGGHTKEGRLVVVIEWPEEEDGHVFDRDEAVLVGLNLLEVASHLYPDRQEFGEVINRACARVNLRPMVFPPRNGTEERPVV